MPQVSVIVPAKDVADYIGITLADLGQQTFTDFEVLVVDDGSSDDTRQVIERFAEQDKRFRAFSSGGAGVSTARNVGIANASGEFLAFVDADDRVSANYLRRLHETIAETGSDIASCNAVRLEGYVTSVSILHRRACAKSETRTHLSRSPQLVWDTTVWNKLWRREMWDRAGIHYAEGRWLNDFYPCMRGHVSSKTVDVITEPLYYWRIRTDPTTSITDSRLTHPAARLKSFGDRMFAMRSARRMIADELPVAELIEAFDRRLLRSDLPIYLPYYVGSDKEYRETLVNHIGELLEEFDIQPQRFQLGSAMQLVYQAIRSRDHETLEALLHPQTEVVPSDSKRQQTVLALPPDAPVAKFARSAATSHTRIGKEQAKLASALHLRATDVVPLTVDTQIDGIQPDPERPSTLVIHGVVRLQEGRGSVAGDWSIAAALEASPARGGSNRVTRTVNRVQRIAKRPVRVLGASTALSKPPDESLHPLVRSGWRPFRVTLNVTDPAVRESDTEWRLHLHLSAGKMDLFPIAKLTGEAIRYLPASFHLDEEIDLVPATTGKGRVTLRKERIRSQLTDASPSPTGMSLTVRIPQSEGTDTPAVIWFQSVDKQILTQEVQVTGEAVEVPLPELTGDSVRFELWSSLSGRQARVRAHPAFRTTYVDSSSRDREFETVLRPTAQGRVVLEARPRQLGLTWLRVDETASHVLIGGTDNPERLTDAPLTLRLSCLWSGEQLEAPIRTHPEGWQAAVDAETLLSLSDTGRGWALSIATSSGATLPPVRVPIEWRPRLPFEESIDGHTLHIRLGDQAVPALWVNYHQDHSRWRQFRKVQRSRPGTAPLAPSQPAEATNDSGSAEPPASEGGDPAPATPALLSTLVAGRDGAATIELEALLGSLTAPQASRSMTDVSAPSFREKVDLRIRRRRYLLQFTDTLPVTEPLIRKEQRDRILTMLGLAAPAKLLETGDADAVIEVLRGRDEAVVKPLSGAIGKGVFLLRRSSDGWTDLRTEREISDEELRNLLETTTARQQPVTEWQVEELVTGDANALGHPMDFKLYMFQGRHGLTVQMKRLPKRSVYKFYDPSWRPVDVGRDSNRLDPTLPSPDDPQPLLEIADLASKMLPLPFIRIDILVGRDKLYIGEVTPIPGRFHRFSEEVDRELGLLWEMAEFEHGYDFLTADRFQPAITAIQKVTGAERLYPD